MRVKICGITNFQDAMQAIDAGADALGFVFYRESPRYIKPADAKKIIEKIPPFIGRVGLFVNEGIDTIDTISTYCDLTLCQIHFDVDEEALGMIGSKAMPVIRAREPKDILQYSNRYRLVDAYCEEYGGSGKRLNLEWFKGIDCSKIILAGGLTPENLHEVKKYNFYGVDVSSGVERMKGKKDPQKVAKFIANAKSL
jgi:phosphoribosylanthranilate isomerase